MKKYPVLLFVLIPLLVGCKKDNPTENTPIPTTPVVSILSPTSSEVIGDSVKIQISATDDKGITKVEIYIDNQIPQGGTLLIAPYIFIWNAEALIDSSAHLLYAKAYDADGNVSSTPIKTIIAYKFTPSQLQVTFLSDTVASLTWHDNSRKETGFEIERKLNAGNFELVKTVGENVTNSLVPGSYIISDNISFRVRAIDENTKSSYSNTVTKQLVFPAPSNLVVNISSETKASLSWTNTNSMATMVVIEKSTNGTNYTIIDSTMATYTTKDVAGIYSSDTTYSFRVKYKSAINQSAYTALVSKKLSFPAPTNFGVNISTETKASLSWTNTNSMATTVVIEKSTNGTNYDVVDSIAATATTKDVVGIYSSDTTYYFRIKYKSNVNQSAYTTPVSQKLSFPAPSNLAIGTMTTAQVSLSWTDNSSFETSFDVEQSTNGTTFAVVNTVGSNITSATITGTYDSTIIYYFRVKAKTSINNSGYSNTVGIRMSLIRSIDIVFVQSGTFQMGSNDVLDVGSIPPHSVTVGSFNIDKYEITYEKWTEVYSWALKHGYTDLTAGQNSGGDHPVTMINWYDILKWCNARSEKDFLLPVYYTSNTLATVYRTGQIDLAADAVKWTANGYRLPTEAEWEFAARGGNKSKGYIYSGSNTMDSVAWTHSSTYPVGTLSPNELVIYDMSGNVIEWCWDWYGAYSSNAQTDPRGATSGTYRVQRGGGGASCPQCCRVANRSSYYPIHRDNQWGFRCTQDY